MNDSMNPKIGDHVLVSNIANPVIVCLLLSELDMISSLLPSQPTF